MKMSAAHHRSRARPPARGGFLIMDMIIGMLLLGALTVVLAVGARAQQRGAAHLNDSRAALRGAEAALLELQTGAAQPSPRRGVTVRVIEDATTAAPPRHRWVSVEATCNGRVASLYGLIPSAGGGDPR